MAEQQVSFCGPPAVHVPAVQVVAGAVGQLLAHVVVEEPGSQLPGGKLLPPEPVAPPEPGVLPPEPLVAPPEPGVPPEPTVAPPAPEEPPGLPPEPDAPPAFAAPPEPEIPPLPTEPPAPGLPPEATEPPLLVVPPVLACPPEPVGWEPRVELQPSTVKTNSAVNEGERGVILESSMKDSVVVDGSHGSPKWTRDCEPTVNRESTLALRLHLKRPS
jgi:hypothetical protein